MRFFKAFTMCGALCALLILVAPGQDAEATPPAMDDVPAVQMDVEDPTLDFDAGLCISPIAADCLNCGRDSDGACKGAQQCTGSRKECKKRGCKISGTSSCSTSANVKKC